jgi:N-acyl-D-amino-acid deacylase
MPSPSKILFRSPTVISGDPDEAPYTADVLINTQTGLIEDIHTAISSRELQENDERRIVDAKGCVLCPGFIDMHAHSDLYLLTNPEHEAKISQGCTVSPGVPFLLESDIYHLPLSEPSNHRYSLNRCFANYAKTEVIGQDGISYAPVRTAPQLQAIREQIAGWNGNPGDEECGKGGKFEGKGLFEWRSLGEYLDCLERNGVATNVLGLVPQVSDLSFAPRTCSWKYAEESLGVKAV